MARCTILAQSQFVHLVVVLLVAGKAIARGIDVDLCLVTFLAVHLDMHSKQREARPTMIEFGFFPVVLVMTGFASFTQLGFVNIFLKMTTDAGRS